MLDCPNVLEFVAALDFLLDGSIFHAEDAAPPPVVVSAMTFQSGLFFL
jgi:hypothetical protein